MPNKGEAVFILKQIMIVLFFVLIIQEKSTGQNIYQGDQESNDPIAEKIYKYCRNQSFTHKECRVYRINIEKAKLFYEKNKCGEIEPDHPDCE